MFYLDVSDFIAGVDISQVNAVVTFPVELIQSGFGIENDVVLNDMKTKIRPETVQIYRKT